MRRLQELLALAMLLYPLSFSTVEISNREESRSTLIPYAKVFILIFPLVRKYSHFKDCWHKIVAPLGEEDLALFPLNISVNNNKGRYGCWKTCLQLNSCEQINRRSIISYFHFDVMFEWI